MNAAFTRCLFWHLRHNGRRVGPLGLMGLALIVAAVLFAAVAVPSSQAKLSRLQQASASLHERLQRAAGSFDDGARTPAEQLAGFYDAFPAMAAAPDLLANIYRAAEHSGIKLQQGEYRARRERIGALTRYQIVLPVSGPYPRVRAFLADVLRQIPFVALDNVSFQRGKIGEAAVEARISLTLYLGEET